MAGRSNSFGDGDDDVMVVKTNQYGEMEWIKTYGRVDFEGAFSLIQVSDGGFALAGYTWTYTYGERLEDALLIVTDENGEIERYRTYGNVYSDSFRSLVELSSGGYVIAGKFVHYSSPDDSDFWLIKTDEFGVIPEFPSWFTLPLFTVSILVLILIRNKLKRKG